MTIVGIRDSGGQHTSCAGVDRRSKITMRFCTYNRRGTRQLTRQRIILTGDVPSPINPPSGYRFHTRCPFAFDRCRVEEPILRSVGDGHVSACHLDHVPGGQVVPMDA
jgi:oligopeptide/dipeptide ABC transporter ATP-binding protein